MEKFEEVLRKILSDHLEELNDVVVDCLLEDLIEGILQEIHRVQEMDFESFKKTIIEKLRESEKKGCQQ